jgi:hypothetical protein
MGKGRPRGGPHSAPDEVIIGRGELPHAEAIPIPEPTPKASGMIAVIFPRCSVDEIARTPADGVSQDDMCGAGRPMPWPAGSPFARAKTSLAGL